jgi:ribosomal protein S18 acetylase RimI-like enzyme
VNNIENNLYEFYRNFGAVKTVKHIQEKGYEVIQAPHNSWPQMIFNLDPELDPQKLIPTIADEIENKKYPSFFIAPENFLSRKHSELLKSNKIAPVKILTGMNFIPARIDKIELPQGCDICDLVDKTQLIDFADIIKKELISPEMSFQSDVLSEIKSCKEIQMTGLFCGKTLVSSMLVLTNENVSGLYFIITRKEYQHRGFATILINFILNRLYDDGVKEIILHANHSSFGLYKKLGFIEQNRFIIYRKF